MNGIQELGFILMFLAILFWVFSVQVYEDEKRKRRKKHE